MTPKILIIRFSAIGDIVLTAPALTLLRQALPEAEVHFLTKRAFTDLVKYHPTIHKVYALEDTKFSLLVNHLKAENYHFVLDLHQSLRSLRLLIQLRKPFALFQKPRLYLWLHVYLKWRSLKISHVCDRYVEAAQKCVRYFNPAFSPDALSPKLDFFMPMSDTLTKVLAFNPEEAYSVVLGAAHPTKQWLPDYFISLINLLGKPVILLGGKAEMESAQDIGKQLHVPFYDGTGRYSLPESATLMAKTRFVITHDTGFMHIASALGMTIFSLWGSTSPKLGFGPYQNPTHFTIEMTNLSCHPCSRIGNKSCPQKHFKCMTWLTPPIVFDKIIKVFPDFIQK